MSAPASSSSGSSNLPVKKESNIPGKSCYVIWRSDFLIEEKYVPIKAIGKGAYGVVCSAKNLVTGEKVAIKKIGNAFENLTDARRTLREIKLLRHLRHENIIAVRDVPMPPNRDKYNDVYIVYELMDTDLHQIIRSSQTLTNEHFQYFVYQVSMDARTQLMLWEEGSDACPLFTILDPQGPQVCPQRQRAASGPETEQPAPQRLVRFEDLRLRAGKDKVSRTEVACMED